MADALKIEKNDEGTLIVDGAAPNEELEQVLSPREAVLQKIVENNNKSRAAEIAETGYGTDQEPKAEASETEHQPARKAEPSGDVEMVTVKIDGVESQIPKDQMIADYQKHAHGANLITEAGKARKQLDADRAALDEERRLLRGEADKKTLDVEAETRNTTVTEGSKAIAEAIYDGDPDDVAKVLATTLNAIAAPVQQATETTPVDTAQIADTVLSRVEVEQSRRAGVRALETDYPELVKDDVLFGMVDAETNKIIDAGAVDDKGAPLSPEQIIVKAAGNVDTWRKSLTGGAEPQGDGARDKALSAREEAKRKLGNLQGSTASGRADIGKEQPKPLTAHQKFLEIKGARPGQDF